MRNCITVKYHDRVSNDAKISYPYCGKYIRYIRETKRKEWARDESGIVRQEAY
jgi:hypothetical protein